MSTKGTEVLTSVSEYLKNNAGSSVAAACRALGVSPNQYYSARNHKKIKRAPTTAKASVKAPAPHTSPVIAVNPRHGLTMLVVGDAASVAQIARTING